MIAGEARGEVVHVRSAAQAEEIVVAVGAHATQTALAVHSSDQNVSGRAVHALQVADGEEVDFLGVRKTEIDSVAVALGRV